jgi:hypothetical protein
MTKTCTKCHAEKPLDAFSPHSGCRFGVSSICKACTSDRGKAWAKANPERHAANRHRYVAANRQHVIAYHRQWNADNAASEKARLALWAKEHADRTRAKTAKRRAKLHRAMPAWTNPEHIAHFYRWAKEASDALGIPFEVDHLVPLRHPLVCGLHVPENLTVRTRASNRSKGNRFDPMEVA